MTAKHDPEITPLPAPLPGLSMEVEAISLSATSAPTTRDTDPDMGAPPVAFAPRHRQWWVIAGLGLFAVGVGVGALLWQPAPTNPLPGLPIPPLPAMPSVPSMPVAVMPIAPLPAPPGPAVTPAAPPGPAPAPVEAKRPRQELPSVALKPQPTPQKEAPTPPPAELAVAAKPSASSKARPVPKVTKGPTSSRPMQNATPGIVAAPAPPSLEPTKQLSQALIRQTMLASEARWKSCIKEAWGTNISIGIIVDSSGQVQKADILGAIAQSATGRCITDQIRKLRFPPFTEGGASKQFFWSYQIPSQ